MSSDPLSFFAVGDDDTSDSDTEDKTDNETAAPVPVRPNNAKLLPPPMDALAEAKRPEFTINPLRQAVDWDKLTKKAPELPEKEYKPWVHKLPSVDRSVKTESGVSQLTLAQHVPGASASNSASGPVTEGSGRLGFVDHALQWSKTYQNLDKDGHLKRVRPEDIGGEEGFCFTDLEAEKVAYGGKRQKVAQPTSFRAKEAKKRKEGKANRDKMFVEDEKRVLRQQLDKNY